VVESVPAIEGAKNLKNRSKENLFLVIVLSIFLFLTLATVIYYYQKRALAKDLQDGFVLTSAERAEFRELRRYFTLSAKPTLPELHQSYRNLAKKLHPDVSGGAKEFTELHEKFILAQSIIKKIATNKDENIRST
jgi:hypothetical protein